MAHKKQITVNGMLFDVTEFDNSAQDIDDAVNKVKSGDVSGGDKNAIHVEGGATMTLEGDFGEGPHTIEVTPDETEENAAIYESADHPGCFYRLVGAEREWFNPPMAVGAEYRTTERWNGKPVYVKLVDCGELPNSTVKYVNFCALTEFAACLGMQGVRYAPDGYGRYIHPGGSISLSYSNSTTHAVIEITTTSNWDGNTAHVGVKYTKTTD